MNLARTEKKHREKWRKNTKKQLRILVNGNHDMKSDGDGDENNDGDDDSDEK